MKEFLRIVFSGSDNQSPAIGRVLGAFVVAIFLLCVPTAIVVAMWLQKVEWTVWEKLFTSLTLYVPAISAAAISFISLTAHTEPKP